jgi:L-arabinose isomerase
MVGLEYVKINKDTKTSEFKQNLRNNEVYFMLNKALK